MNHSKLVKLLQFFSEKQHQKFQLFLDSPYFNTQKDVQQLYQQLHIALQQNNPHALKKETIFAKLFPNTSYDAPQIYYLMSGLLQTVEKFIMVENLQEDSATQADYLLNYYRQQNLEKHFQHHLREHHKQQQKKPQSADSYHYRFLLHQQENLYFDQQKKHLFDQSLQQAIDSLDLYYLVLKLKYSCEMYNRLQMVSGQYELRLLDEIVRYLEQHPQHEHPIVMVYVNIFRCLTDFVNEQHFNDLMTLLQQHTDQFAIAEARDMYAYTINYCVRHINRGNTYYLRELLNIYKRMLGGAILLTEEGLLSPWTYMNIILVGIRNEEYFWTENFIEQYKTYIAPQFRENAYTYNLALLYFYQKQYNRTLQLLNQVVFEDVYYSTEAKMLLLRSYYELDESDAFESLAAAYINYLRRNKLVAEQKKQRYETFIKLLVRLHRLLPRDKKALQQLKQKIEATPTLLNKAWLLEKWTLKAQR